jgi:hypothetical protein
MKLENSHGGLAGRSILEMLMEQLDMKWAEFMEDDASDEWETYKTDLDLEDEDLEFLERVEEYFTLKGKLAGIGYAIAKIRNPYKPDIAAVSAEAQERWEAADGDQSG